MSALLRNAQGADRASGRSMNSRARSAGGRSIVRVFLKRMRQALPLLLIPIGIHTQQYYLSMSEGTGAGFAEIPRASSDKLIEALKRLGETVKTPVVITDSANGSLIKFEAAYLRGRQFLTPVKKILAGGNANVEDREFDLMSGGSQIRTNDFKENQEVEQIVARRDNVTLLVSTGNQTALNRFSYPANSDQDVVPVRWKDASNFLIFIHSDRGHSIFTGNRIFTSLFPVFVEGATNSSVAPVGRYLLFRVVNPTAQFRLLLNLSALDHSLPPAAAVIGETRERLDFIGSGSARAISAPMKPQLIHEVPYICIDMGMDSLPIKEIRKGLMRLWSTGLPLDYKRLVGVARNISIITNEEYGRFVPPSGISKIPGDFLNQEFEYSGVHEDGWLSANSYFIFSGNSALQPLVIRGVVPITHDPSFNTNLTAIVDGQEVGRRNLTIGEFEFRFPVSQRIGRRRVELRFDRTQPLLYNDTRRAAALLRCLSFEMKTCQTQDIPDVVTDGNGIWRGDNWYPLEKQNGNTFRWVKNDAEILVAPETGGADLLIDLEPGPSLGGQAMKLEARDSGGKVLLKKDVTHRETVRLRLASQIQNAAGLSTISLHSLNGGGAIAGDTRTLNFRVFRAALQDSAAKPAATNDVAAGDDVIQLGANWYPQESLAADRFRWVNNDAVISISDPRALAKGLTIELEPGPGIKKKPMVLRVLDSAGRQVQAVEITGRQTVNVFPPLTAKRPLEYRLHVDGGGQKIGTDPRILNFRVFKIYSSAHGANAGGDITEGIGLQIGKGWYPLESFTDGTFRWVSNDAEFTVASGRTHLAMELQPGPGVDFKNMVVKVLDTSGRQVQAVEVNGRQTVKLLLPVVKGKDSTYRLHLDGGGKKIPTDPRILNFRVFKLKTLD